MGLWTDIPLPQLPASEIKQTFLSTSLASLMIAFEQQAEQLAQMESVMLDIFTQLSENENVALVDKLQMDAVTSRLLARAEIGLKATAEVVVIF